MKYNQPYGVVDPNAPYVNGDPTIGRAGSIPPAGAFEEPQRELVSLIANAGFVPSHSDLAQVTRSVRQGVNYLVGAILGGNVNTIGANSPSGVPTLDAYRAGLTLRVLWPANNSGPATLNIDGLGARTIVRANGAATAANDLQAGMMVELADDGTRFQIVNFQGFTSTTTNNNTYLVNLPYIADSSATPNSVLANFSPAVGTLTAGTAILVKLANNFTGPATITVNANPVKAITHPDGSAIQNGDAVIGAMLFMVYDGVAFQLENFVPPARTILTAPRTWYVNSSTGNDSNSGIDAAHAFQHIQRAVDVMQTYDLNGYTVTISVAAGSYGPVTCKPITGSGYCNLTGDATTPSNVTVTAAAGAAIVVIGTGYTINGFRTSAPTNNPGATDGVGIVASGAINLNIANCEYLYCAESHIYAQLGAQVSVSGMDRVSGGAGYDHCTAVANAVIDTVNAALTITTPVSFGGQFWQASGGILTSGSTGGPYASITNKAYVTGRKFLSHALGSIQTNNGTDYLPGTVAGYVEPGSFYA